MTAIALERHQSESTKSADSFLLITERSLHLAFGLSCIAFGIMAIYQTVIYPDFSKGLN